MPWQWFYINERPFRLSPMSKESAGSKNPARAYRLALLAQLQQQVKLYAKEDMVVL